MKRFIEPFTGMILSFISWDIFSDFMLSLFIAFLGGALAYLGKYISAKIVDRIDRKRNVYTSQTQETINRHNSPEIDD